MIEPLRWIIAVVCLWALFVVGIMAAEAQSNTAASFLGICHRKWSCKESLRVFDDLPVKRVRWLAETFGRSCSCAKKFLRLPGKKEVHVHLANGTCFPERGRRCDKGEPFHGESIASADRKLTRKNPGILRKYRASLKRTKRILKGADTDTTLYLSLCLECPLSGRARRSLLSVAQEIFPGGNFIDSVLTQRCLKGLICEKHGAAPRVSPPCVIDTDGLDIREIDQRKFLKAGQGCVASGGWLPGFNLLPPNGRFQLPLRRTTRPTASEFRAIRRWLRR